jgi:hypothetical protein
MESKIEKLKLNGKYIVSIFVLAALSTFIWIIELFYHGWGGLKWISYFHYSLCIIPFLFIIWLFYISFNLKVKTHPIFYSIIYIVFFIFSYIIFYVQMISGPTALSLLLLFPDNINIFQYLIQYIFYICIILEIIIIYIINIIICLYEKRKINKKDIFIIALHIIIVPIMSIIISLIILLPINYARYCFDPIHWFKTGSIIFSFIIYECSYIYYIKNKGHCI